MLLKKVLSDHLEAVGIVVERNTEAVALHASADGVTVDVRHNGNLTTLASL